MKVEFKKSFAKDLKKKSDHRKLMDKAKQVIEQVEQADDLHHIANLKKLKAIIIAFAPATIDLV